MDSFYKELRLSPEERFNKILFIGYNALFFLALFAGLCANSLFKISWPNECDSFLFCLYDCLWLLSYVIICLLGFLSLYFQLKTMHKDKISDRTGKLQIVGQLFLAMLILVGCIFSYRERETSGLFALIPLAFLAWVVSKKKIVLFSLLYQIAFLVLGFGLFFLGYTHDLVYFEHGVRHTFGFQHPNTVGLWVASIIMLFGLFKSNKKNSNGFAIAFIATSVVAILVTFYFTKSRTSLISVLLFLTLYGLNHFFTDIINGCFEKRIVRLAFEFLPVVCLGTSVIFGYLFNAIAWKTSNFAFRFYEGIYAIQEYGLKLFGLRPWGFVVDNGYFAMLLFGGGVLFTCYEILAVKSCKQVLNNKHLGAMAFMTSLYFYMMMENYWLLWPIMFVGIAFAFSNKKAEEKQIYFKQK